MQALAAHPITRDAFAPYGWLIDAAGFDGRAINAGSSQRIDGLTDLVLDRDGGSPCLAIFRAQARELAGPWHEMERHVLGTQTFVPLNGARCVVLVASGGAAPDPATLAAFLVAGHQGITLRPGTWHHALLALDGGDFVVLERRAAQVDCEIAMLAQAVSISLA
ncbi:MAG: ureidoglycolate lyase [Burkholderiales bacterium]